MRTFSAQVLIGDPIRQLHQGQRQYAPHERAGHMTAPDQAAKTILKPLARGGRPFLHQRQRPQRVGSGPPSRANEVGLQALRAAYSAP